MKMIYPFQCFWYVWLPNVLLFFKLVYFADDRVEEAANESEDNSMLFAYSFMSFVGHMFVKLCLDLFEI